MSMRMAASAAQVEQVRTLPRGARTTRGPESDGVGGENVVIVKCDVCERKRGEQEAMYREDTLFLGCRVGRFWLERDFLEARTGVVPNRGGQMIKLFSDVLII